jgi:hypothetical protein
MVRRYVPEHVWQVLAELSYLSHQLCAKELSLAVIDKLEKSAPVLLCKLEIILHLPREAQLGGMENRWCYPIERVQKVL